MRSKLQSDLYRLKANRNGDEKLLQADDLIIQLVNHFYDKASISKRYYTFYKYSSIVLAAITAIISSLQVIYAGKIPHWILPVVSSSATVMVAFLGASSAQKIWINSRTTQQHLQVEQFLFNQHSGRYAGLQDGVRLQLFTERITDLWNDGHSKWEQNVGND